MLSAIVVTLLQQYIISNSGTYLHERTYMVYFAAIITRHFLSKTYFPLRNCILKENYRCKQQRAAVKNNIIIIERKVSFDEWSKVITLQEKHVQMFSIKVANFIFLLFTLTLKYSSYKDHIRLKAIRCCIKWFMFS